MWPFKKKYDTKRYTQERASSRGREVYDDNTGTWILLAVLLSDSSGASDYSSPSVDRSSGSNDYSSSSDSSSSSSYDSGGSFDSGGDFGGGGGFD